jgi:hypothetical protein
VLGYPDSGPTRLEPTELIRGESFGEIGPEDQEDFSFGSSQLISSDFPLLRADRLFRFDFIGLCCSETDVGVMQ